jgi:hypothetical protein
MVFTRDVPIQELELIDSAYHRNGVSGAPFDVVLFNDEGTRKVAILFPEPFHCALLDVGELERNTIQSRWRGDAFEANLRMPYYPNSAAAVR